jgi:copper chaperone CopZ
MKKTQIAIFSFLLLSIFAWAKSQEATIKSSLVCEMCEDNIRNGLVYEKGIKRVTFDLEKSEVYVKFNPKHISLDEIENLITKIGYDANEKKS